MLPNMTDNLFAVFSDIPGCRDSGCYPGAQCRDVAAPGTGYSCGACPSGYQGDGLTCLPLPHAVSSRHVHDEF